MSNNELTFGLHAVQTLLERHPGRVQRLWVLKGRQDRRLQQVVRLAERHRLPMEFVPRSELDQRVDGVHQGIIAECEGHATRDERFLDQLLESLEEPPLLLVLDGVTDPHNLGACLRTADAAGAHALIVPKDKSAPLNATAVKVACGAAEAVPVVSVTNLARTLKQLQERGLWITGTAGEAENTVFEADLTGPLVLVMGAEGKGMRRLTREHCDSLIKIPMAGEVSSLNVSVATGVCLFEAVRQRRSGA